MSNDALFFLLFIGLPLLAKILPLAVYALISYFSKY